MAKRTDYPNSNFSSLLELKETNSREVSAEVDKYGQLELTIEVTSYGCCSMGTEDHYVFLPRDEAIALAEFILEQTKREIEIDGKM